MMKATAALRMNNKAVIDESQRLNDPNYERKRNREELYAER
jgi:hypothetical protein